MNGRVRAPIIVICVLLIIAPLGIGAALASDGTTWTTGYILQNIGTDPANVLVEYYDTSGTPISGATKNVTDLAPGTAFASNQGLDASLSSPWSGSIVASSSQPLGAVIAVQGSNGDTAMYTGFSGGDDKVYLPALYKNYGVNTTTEFAVQNTTGAPADISIAYYDRLGNPMGTVPDTLEAYSSEYYKTSDVSLITESSWSGSAIVTTTGANIVAAVVDYRTDDAGAYNGILESQGDTMVYLPAIYRYFGPNTSGFIVQNLGGSAATISADYYDRLGNFVKTVSSPSLVNPNTAWARNQMYDSDLGTGWSGSVVVTSTPAVPLAGVVSVQRTDGSFMFYTGTPSGAAGSPVYLPAIYRNFGPNTSGFIVQNLGGSAATISADYYDRDGNFVKTVSSPSPVDPNTAWARNQVSDTDLGASWSGSIVVTCSQPIAAVASNSRGIAGDFYEGQYAPSP